MDPADAQRRIAVVYVEADDLAAMFKGLATSDEPFDRWFRAYVSDVHGVALEDEFPLPNRSSTLGGGTDRDERSHS